MHQTCKMDKVEVRVVMKYLKYLIFNKVMTPNCKEIHEDFMKTLGNESPSYSTVKKWAAEFKRGGESIEDDARSGSPKDATTDENVEIILNLVMCDRRLDLQSIVSEVGISFGAVQTIPTDILGMSNVSARWVPRMLTDDQKRSRLDISRYLLSRMKEERKIDSRCSALAGQCPCSHVASCHNCCD